MRHEANHPRPQLVRRRVRGVFVAAVLTVWAFAGTASAQPQQGDILVADFDAGGPGFLGRLFLVDPLSGLRTVVTDFGAPPDTGGIDPRWIALERDGGILIVDQTAGTNDLGALIRIDRNTGTPVILSDFGDSGQGPLGADPLGVAVEADGGILVMDRGAGTTPPTPARLFRIDPLTGFASC